MKKTMMTEVVITILMIVLGVLGFYFLGGTAKTWLVPLLSVMVLLGFLVRWQFVVTAGVLMPFITALLTLQGDFSWASIIVKVAVLTATGLLICFAYQYWKWEVHPSLVFGLLFGRVLGGCVAWLLKAVFAMGTFSNLFSYTVNSLVSEICGIAMLLAVVPLLVRFVFQKMFHATKRKK